MIRTLRRYIICWGNLSLSKIIGGGGGGGGTPHRRILLFCKYVYLIQMSAMSKTKWID